MAKYGKLPVKNYTIYHFDLSLLFEYGKIENGVLLCDNRVCRNSYYLSNSNNKELGIDVNKDSLLFDQTIKALKKVKKYNGEESYFEDIFVNIDFKNFLKVYKKGNDFKQSLLKIRNGIKLVINNKEIHVVDFMKSSSMSKNCCMYFINKEYKDLINDRITFGLDKGEFVLSKWYAYSGLSLSDVTILNDIKFQNGEIVVIPDNEFKLDCDCITAVSIDYLYALADETIKIIRAIKGLYNDIDKITLDNFELIIKSQSSSIKKRLYKNKHELDNVIKQINCFINSTDYNSLKENQTDSKQRLIIEVLDIFKDTFDFQKNYTLDIIRDLLIKNIKVPFESYMNSFHQVYWHKFMVKNFPTQINKFDGEGLISKEFCYEINKTLKKLTNNEKDKFGFTYQIRLPFIKGIVSSCDIKTFYKEKGITHIKGLTFSDSDNEQEKYKEYPIENVKMIITKSQFKCASFIRNINKLENETPFDAYMRLLNEYDYKLGITNLEPNHENLVNLNYQFFSTVPFNKRAVKKIVGLNKFDYKKQTSVDTVANDLLSNKVATKEKTIYNLNKYFFLSTKKYKTFRSSQLYNKKKAYLNLKFVSWGKRKFICGDLLELLYHSAYHNDNKKCKINHIPINKFYAPNSNFKDNEKCLLLRNPHYSRNEIAVLLNYNKDEKNNERIKYFSHLTGVLMYNPLTQLADRLGGADYDGDTIVVLNNKYLSKTMNDLFKKENEKYILKYPLIKIPSLGAGKLQFNYENKVNCLFNTFDSRIGIISNNAFKETFGIYKNTNYSINHDRIAFYTMINGLEIDSAKQGIKPKISEGYDNEMGKFFLQTLDKINYGKVTDKDRERIKEYRNKHIIFKMLYNAYLLKAKRLKNIKINDVINNNNVSIERIEKMFIIYSSYLIINKIIEKHNKLIMIQKQNFESGSPLVNKIKDILRKNGVDEDKLIEFCMNFYNKVGSLNVVNEYCSSEIKYHYLIDDNQKRTFIEKLNLKEPLSIYEEKIIFNFENDGYMLLYLLLYYSYNSIKGYENKVTFNSKDLENIFNKVLKLLKIRKNEDEYINHFNKNKKQIINKIANMCDYIIHSFGSYNPLDSNNTYDPYTKKGIDYMVDKTYSYLAQQSTNLKLDVFLCFKKVNEDNFIFDVLYPQLIEYLTLNSNLIIQPGEKDEEK